MRKHINTKGRPPKEMNTTPVLLISFNRPQYLEKRLIELIVNENVKSIIVSLDFHSDAMTKRYEEIFEKFESSQVQLSVVKHQQNIGLAKHIPAAVEQALQQHVHIIVIEDDIVIGPGSIKSFERARNILDSDPEILTIGGYRYSPWLLSSIFENRWTKTDYFSAWGWMTSREKWEFFRMALKDENVQNTFENQHRNLNLTESQKRKWINRFLKCQMYEERTWDIPVQYWTFKHGKKHVLPIFRMFENEGFGNNESTNTKSMRPKWMGKFRTYNSVIEPKMANRITSRLFNIIDSFSIGNDRDASKLKLIGRLMRNEIE